MFDAPVFGAVLVVASGAIFAYFWPRAGRPTFYERSPFIQDMVPLAALSGFVVGAMMLLGPILK